MEGDGFPTHPPPAKRQKKSSTVTTIASLGYDVLLEIFMRLPSLATLVRAALTCRAWRHAVASSGDFRRRFLESHPAPLLGLFFDAPGAAQSPAELPAFPSFVPARGVARRDPAAAAAAFRGGDFFLTSLTERPGVSHGWDIHDCRGGYLLLANSDRKTMAVLNPLAPRSQRFFNSFGLGDDVDAHALEGHSCCIPLGGGVRSYSCVHCSEVALDARLLCAEEDPMSFRVVVIAYDKSKKSRLRAAVFSSDTGEWSALPWVDAPLIVTPVVSSAAPFTFRLLNGSMQANGSLYWAYRTHCKHVLKLDTSTMEFSVVELPRARSASEPECSFLQVGETRNGTPCVVYVSGFTVSLFVQRTDGGGERWVRDKAISLGAQLDGLLGKLKMKQYTELRVTAVRDGFAYLATSTKRQHATTPHWVFALCLETGRLEEPFQRTYQLCVHPYLMPWPPSLVGNYGSFALEGGAQHMHYRRQIDLIQDSADC